ncbi:MAG: hypothetical protein ACP5MD_15140, partial [Verrucomicrobiia bacterium]
SIQAPPKGGTLAATGVASPRVRDNPPLPESAFTRKSQNCVPQVQRAGDGAPYLHARVHAR